MVKGVSGMKKLVTGINCDTKYAGLPTKHAEVDAINKLKNKKNIPRIMDILVIRLSKSGELGESRPCYHCICALERSHLNIRSVYYSTRDGKIMKEKLTHMKHNSLTCISSGMRHRMKQQGYDYTKLLYDDSSSSSSTSSTSSVSSDDSDNEF